MENIIIGKGKRIENIMKCKNPRCITTTEKYIANEFYLIDKEKGEYGCCYCDDMSMLMEE